MLPPMIHAPAWDRCTSPPRMTVGQSLFALWSADLEPVPPPWIAMFGRNLAPARLRTLNQRFPNNTLQRQEFRAGKPVLTLSKPRDVASSSWGPHPRPEPVSASSNHLPKSSPSEREPHPLGLDENSSIKSTQEGIMRIMAPQD